MADGKEEYGVFVWHPDPRYHRSEAVKIYKRKSSAEGYAEELNEDGGNYVVRPLSYALNPRAGRRPRRAGR